MSLYLFDKKYRTGAVQVLAGVDEAGRGAWAGPLVAAAVILPADFSDERVNDSKTLTPEKREELFTIVTKHAIAYAAVAVAPGEIDKGGVGKANVLAFARAIERLSVQPDLTLIDGRPVKNLSYTHEAIVDGDALSLSIAAASIVAKVTRDRLMVALHKNFPQYGFAAHKGYGTAEHQAALRTHGPSVHHRFSYAPIRALVRDREM